MKNKKFDYRTKVFNDILFLDIHYKNSVGVRKTFKLPMTPDTDKDITVKIDPKILEEYNSELISLHICKLIFGKTIIDQVCSNISDDEKSFYLIKTEE